MKNYQRDKTISSDIVGFGQKNRNMDARKALKVIENELDETHQSRRIDQEIISNQRDEIAMFKNKAEYWEGMHRVEQGKSDDYLYMMIISAAIAFALLGVVVYQF